MTTDAAAEMSVEALEARVAIVPPEKAAALLGIEVGTLANWRCRGVGPRFLRLGGRVRYRLADLADYLDAQTRTRTSRGADGRVISSGQEPDAERR